MLKMHQNTFGGWAPPGPAAEAYALPSSPIYPLAAMGGLLLRGTEGRGGQERGNGKGAEGNPPKSR